MIYILVEDDWDRDYYEKILEPKLYEKYNQVIPYKYIRKPKPEVIKYVKVMLKIGADYYVLTDLNHSPSIECAKEKVSKRMGNLIDYDNIIVVIKEIECWIMAGMKDSILKQCPMSLNISNTEIYDKEEFLPMMSHNPSVFYTRILNTYDIDKALERNSSLTYFVNRIDSIE